MNDLSPSDRRSLGVLWMAAPLWYLLCEAVTASAFPSYSYATFYISDLGVPEVAVLQGRSLDSPLHAVMNAGFIGEGLLFFLGVAILARRSGSWPLVVLGAVHSVGIALVGLVPGSPSHVETGLIVVHALGAVLAIGAGNAFAIASTKALGRHGLVLGIIGFVSAVLLTLHVVLPDGVWERGAVYTFMVWQLWTAACLLRRPRSVAT